MVITVVADVLGKENNGSTIACMNLVNFLKSKGHDVRILCADQDKKGLPGYYIVPNRYVPFLAPIIKKNNVTLAKPEKDIIRSAIVGADYVHIMMPFLLGHKASIVANELNIPISAGFHVQAENFTCHFFATNSNLINHWTYKFFDKRLYDHIDCIHYPTQFIKDYYQNDIKKSRPGYVISNGVCNSYHPMEVTRNENISKHFNLLTVGRISAEKCHKTVIKAVSMCKHKDDIQIVFAGQGPRVEEVRRYAKRFDILPPIIEFKTKEELPAFINMCDLYAHPAQIEIEAISCLEAIACGLVPIISNSPKSATSKFALSEMNKFDWKNPQDLADKIDYWYEHKKEREETSKKYIEFTKQFNKDECMEKMHQMIVEVYKNHENQTSKN